MRYRTLFAALAIIFGSFLAPSAATAATAHNGMAAAKHTCTKTSTGSCIKRGQFCPKAKKGHVGWDNKGRKNVCRGAGSHPHWRAPAKPKHSSPAPGRHCDPNYTGACVPIASDVDCAGGSGNGPKYVTGPVHVVGSDIYDLDRDGDGIGCD
jgi:hypothetical protein